MLKILFIIPKLNENNTGASKRAINLAQELSKFYFVRVISKKKILEYKNYKITKDINSSLITNIYYASFFKYSAWFCDDIRWSLFPKKKLIFTLHDMKEFTKHNRKGLLKKILLRLIIVKSRHFITVSENQKKIIFNILGKLSKVVLNSVSKEWHKQSRLDFDKIKTKYNLQDKYVVYVSNFTKHKNHLSLLNQVKIKKKYTLLLIGTPIDKNGKKILNILKKDFNVIILENIGENELISIVDNCVFSIFPSHYEGFGMPILETIARGKNILVNNQLELDHFKNSERVKFVSFDKIINDEDILWAETYHNQINGCISTKDWSDSAASLRKYINA